MELTKIIVTLIVIPALIVSCAPEKKKEHHEPHKDKHSNMLILSENERLMANIRTETAVIKNISENTLLAGKTAIDEKGVKVITARLKGRLDQLFVKNPGEHIVQGQAIYSIYSEELLADENDYIRAVEQYNNAIAQKEIAKQLLDASRKKLLLWTLTEAQINVIEKSKKAENFMKFYSPYPGYVLEIPVREGEYVEVGSVIFKVADLNTLWIETQVYSDEVKYLNQNPTLSVEFEVFPDEIFKGAIIFDNPLLEEGQKVNLIRVQVSNTNNKLKPGMMAYIYLKRNEKKTLVIPKSALLVESAISVWVENNDGMFEQRMVTTGIENKKEIEILSGIKPGEKVVVSGAYFLKSESVIRQGGGDMGGMKM